MSNQIRPDAGNPTDTVLVPHDADPVTRERLLDLIEAIQADAARLGLEPGHRVAVLLADCWQHPVLTFSLSQRVSCMPLNPDLTDRELAEMLREAKVSLLLGEAGSDRAAALGASAGCAVGEVRTEAGGIALGMSGPPPAPLAGRHQGLLLSTSGSTGSPKRVPITMEAMAHSARTIAATLALSPQDCAVHALPMFHIGAVVDLFLAPLLAGGRVAFAASRTPEGLHRAVTQQGGTWVQLVPTMLMRCADELSDAERGLWRDRLRFIRSVSADLSAERHTQFEARFDGLPIIQMYGMTETAGQICSNPVPPAERRPGTVGRPDGAEVALLDSTGSPVAGEGEVCVRGPGVMAGYELSERGTHFWGDWLRTGDLGVFDDHGYLRLTGRVKEIINRGGEKISPLEIERAALRHPAVAEAVAYALPHPSLGEQPGLTVVARPGSGLTEAVLLAHLSDQLAEIRRPRFVTFLDALPRLGSGKVDRVALSGRRAEQAVRIESLSPVGRKVASLWQERLGGAQPLPEEDFFDAGGDSLSATRFLLELEEALGRSVDPNLLYEHPRFGALIAALEQEEAVAAEPGHFRYVRAQMANFQGPRPGPHRLVVGRRTMAEKAPVFLAMQGEYDLFEAGLDPDRPRYLLRTIQAFEGKTEAMIRELADAYVEEITAICPEGPLHFIGFCDGAKLMHFMAERLAELGRVPEVFVSIDYHWPRVWNGPVLHVFTQDFLLYPRPELGLGGMTRGGCHAMTMRGEHLEALSGADMPALLARCNRLMDGTERLPPSRWAPEQEDRSTLYSAGIRPRVPRTFRPGQKGVAEVVVQNLSGQDWPPSELSGLGLHVSAYNIDGYLRQRTVGFATLPGAVAAGETVTLTLDLTYPDKLLPLQLRFAMTDRGTVHFARRTGEHVGQLIWPIPFRGGS